MKFQNESINRTSTAHPNMSLSQDDVDDGEDDDDTMKLSDDSHA